MDGKVLVYPDETSPIRIYVFPQECITWKKDRLQETVSHTRSNAPKDVARYYIGAWSAFKKPLSSPHKRYLSIKKPYEYIDTKNPPGDDDHKLIQKKYIKSNANHTSQKREASLIEWAEENEIDYRQFQLSQSDSLKLKNNSVLEKILTALSEDQLKRVNLPLDVVKSLNAQKFKR